MLNKSLMSNGWKDIINTQHIGYYFCYNGINEQKERMFQMEPEFVELSIRLAELAAKNTASAVGSKLRAIKSSKDDKKTIAEMNDLIYDLLEEKQEIELIAKTYQEEFTSQKLSEEDLSFVSETVIPVLKKFMENISETQEGQEYENTIKVIKTVESLEPLLSINTLNVLQLIGFNYKKGIGEPLTNLMKSIIAGENKINQNKLNELLADREIQYFKVLQDEESFNRFMSLR